MTTSTLASAQAAGQQVQLAAAEKRRRVRPRALLRDAQDDLRAGGLGEAGQLVHRLLGGEAPTGSGNQTDKRRAFTG